jgi:hypothetical protein
MFIKLKEYDKGPQMLGEPVKTHDVWVRADSIVELVVNTFGRTLIKTEAGTREVLETPDEIIKSITESEQLKLSEDDKEFLRQFGMSASEEE